MKNRSALIFGNGLGMALDNNYFQLASGLSKAWRSEHFTKEQRELVASAIKGITEDDFAHSESQLGEIQLAIIAADILNSMENENVCWLTEPVKKVPQAFRRFVHEAAFYFHESGKELPDKFSTSLAEYIHTTKSHVATLNYDNLLYDCFIRNDILKGFDGALIDGFLKKGFSPDNLDRNDTSKLGWYLHLHGSPLFVGEKKLIREDRVYPTPDEKAHIVLTHISHKPQIISSSPILREYWKRLTKVFSEAEKIILFGYSGEDLHLNDRIISGASEKPIHIIEWDGNEKIEERQKFWQKKLSNAKLNETKKTSINIKVHHLSNVLEFSDWENL